MATKTATASAKPRLLGGYVPIEIADAIDAWVARSSERSRSLFIREAAREKLRRDGIRFETTGPLKAPK